MLIAPALLFYLYLRRRDLPRQAYTTFMLSCPLIILIAEGISSNRSAPEGGYRGALSVDVSYSSDTSNAPDERAPRPR